MVLSPPFPQWFLGPLYVFSQAKEVVVDMNSKKSRFIRKTINILPSHV